MISLKDVSKTYKTKSKSETQALKDVSLNFANCGMVFILGKSGSGKSTLLNLLGGLDSPTSGEIFVDGENMQHFSQRDYDTYRNNYVGFIFQEFNLLSDFNVRDNVALTLKLTQTDNADGKVTDALKQVELNEEYLNRRIDEMSGGEKQRITIARAIIKDSKIILADEPTGNLDSATGESIWNILKNLSRERLVVVVSHDRESAEKYADRIIEIADGQIVADSDELQEQIITDEKTFVSTKQGLSFGARLKMGYNTLRLRKAKTVSVILLVVFSILLLLITQMCLCFSSELTLAKYIQQYDLTHFTVSQGYVSGYSKLFNRYSCIMKNSTKQYIENNCLSINNGIIKSKQDIFDMGLSFVGEALEIDDNSYYITSTELENGYSWGTGVVEVDGEFVEIIKEQHPPEFLIGKKVNLCNMFYSQDHILAGIINFDDMLINPTFPQCFRTENFEDGHFARDINFNRTDPKEVTMQLSGNNYEDELEITDYIDGFISYKTSVIVTAGGIISNNNGFALADNEIVLTYEMYAGLFQADSKWSYINSDLTQLRNIPSEIGKTFNLKFQEYDTNELLVDYGEVKLAGVAFHKNDLHLESFVNKMCCSKKMLRRINLDLSPSNILVSADSVKNLNNFVTTLRKEYLGYIVSVGTIETTSYTGQSTNEVDVANMIYEFEETIKLLSIVFAVICIILLIVLILLVINLISFSIANRKKEIGILSALGTSNKDITSIFLLETLIISAISFAIILVMVFVFAWAFNSILSRGYLLNIVFPFLRVDLITVATLIAMSFGLLLLAALIPIRKIIKLKPIDAIRNV